MRSTVRRLTFVSICVVALTVPATPASAAISAVPVRTGLAFPAAFAPFPGDATRLLYGERFTGEIRILDMDAGTDTAFFTIPGAVSDGGEQGLLGLAFHPDYPSVPDVYAFVTRNTNGTAENHIVKIRNSGGTGSNLRLIFRSTAGSCHNGGRILFGPDDMLYAVIGDACAAANSQSLTTKTGKVLRMTANGGIPSTNPFSSRHTWAYGLRNSFGMAFDPQTGRLWETDNGPSCNDEVNRIERGRNYGWGPSWTCATPPSPPTNTNQDGPNPMLPNRFFGAPTAPTGAAFCTSCSLGTGSEGDLFFGEFVTGRIRQADMTSARWSIASLATVYAHPRGILSLERAADGRMYFSDSGGIYRLVSV